MSKKQGGRRSAFIPFSHVAWGREKWRKLAEEEGGRGERSKRFIVFKPEIERTRWKKGKEEGRKRRRRP